MVNVSKFAKEHIPLCVGTLGFAILGYLGYRAIRWVIHACQRTEKVNQTAQKSIHQEPSSSKPLTNKISKLEISQDKITMGQGEYIVFHKLPTGEKQPLTPETFEEVYTVLLQCSPSELSIEDCTNRYELLIAKLKEIDPTLEAVFVPKTVCELIFIRKCIEEDLRHKEICPYLSPFSHQVNLAFFEDNQQQYERYLEKKEARQKERNCWHLCYFEDTGDNEHVGVKNVAYRLNNAMLEAFNPSAKGLTHKKWAALAEREIEFLKAHYQQGQEIARKQLKGEEVEDISSCNTPGPTTNFATESNRGSAKPMGIRNERDARIIRNAIALDCSKIAQHSLFIYRGADFRKDSVTCWSDPSQSYSLSFGSSVFAGCLYDGGATAFYYMRKEKHAYAIPVPFEQLNDSPFFIPTTHTVTQLFGDGEIFHARTKAWQGFDVKGLGGMNGGANGHRRDHLRSDLSQEELKSQFQAYKDRAIQLK